MEISLVAASHERFDSQKEREGDFSPLGWLPFNDTITCRFRGGKFKSKFFKQLS